jgi:glutaredoxin-dependent peroxiredoxin
MADQVLDLLKKRIASRAISTEAVDDETIQALIEAARLTPSCFNNQPWRYLFLESEAARSKGAEILSKGNQPWAGTAPLLIIGYTRLEDDCNLPDGRAYHEFDLGMATMNLMLAATELGLTARPMAGFSAKKAKEVFDLDSDQQPLVMVAVGKPSADEGQLPEGNRGMNDKPRVRKDASEIVKRI